MPTTEQALPLPGQIIKINQLPDYYLVTLSEPRVSWARDGAYHCHVFHALRISVVEFENTRHSEQQFSNLNRPVCLFYLDGGSMSAPGQRVKLSEITVVAQGEVKETVIKYYHLSVAQHLN